MNTLRTTGRMTTIIPVVPAKGLVHISEAVHEVGRQLVQNILIRKGRTYLFYPNGRWRPVAKAIFTKNMTRLRANESPEEIVSDLIVQLKLL